MDWQDISTAPKGRALDNPWIVLACFMPQLDADGEPDGDPICVWQHVGTWFSDKWQTLSSGFAGIGGGAWMPLRDNPTHWMPLPLPPPPTEKE